MPTDDLARDLACGTAPRTRLDPVPRRRCYHPAHLPNALPRDRNPLDVPPVRPSLSRQSCHGSRSRNCEPRDRNWPWVQSGFMTLHALSMLMKIHSYCSLNGELSERRRQLGKDERELDEVVEEMGGRRKVEREAREEWERQCGEAARVKERDAGQCEGSKAEPLAQPPTDASTSALSSEDETAAAAAALRHRQPTARRRSSSPSASRAGQSSAIHLPEEPQEGVETLTWHPSDRVSRLAIAICEAKDLLSSNGKRPVTFPDNVTFANFIDYLLVPTLVYELEYPRTDSCVAVQLAQVQTLKHMLTFPNTAQHPATLHPRKDPRDIRHLLHPCPHRRLVHPPRHLSHRHAPLRLRPRSRPPVYPRVPPHFLRHLRGRVQRVRRADPLRRPKLVRAAAVTTDARS